MSRPYLLNSNTFGFHARSRVFSSAAAGDLIRAFQKAKGYRDPTTDLQYTAFPVEHPCVVLNIPEATEDLCPWKPWVERWQWSRIKPKLAENWEFLRTWLGEIKMLEKRHSSEGGADCSFFVSASLAGNFWDEVWWTVGAHLSELTGEGLWEDDTVTMKGFRQTVQDWIEIAGYQNHLQVRETSDKPFWSTEIHAVKGAIPTDGPFMGFSGTANCGLFTNVPGTESRTISSLDSCGVNRIQSDMAVSFFEAAIFHVFGEDPAPESITYKPKNDDIPAFREWAVPVFGKPWLQCLGGFANDPANPDDITDDIPDWSLYVVGYFKLVGNRRCLILQKEPGGWRLLLTGKTITNPERHQFLREEIARMAGMTSETLWEPQQVGEGWLGVPG